MPPCFHHRLFLSTLVLAVSCALPAHAQQTFPINANATYLRRGTGSSAFGPGTDSPVVDTVPFSLAALGISSGDTVKMEQLGAFNVTIFGGTDTTRSMIGVFSSTNTLVTGALNSPGADAYDTLNRVPGALLSLGIGATTSNTLYGSLVTDIPQDFFVSAGPTFSTTFKVPTGAAYLFVAANDLNYNDNADPNNDFQFRITDITTSATPEPGAIALFVSGGLSIVTLLRRKRSRK